MEVSGKIGAVIFSPGDQRNCAVSIVLEGQNAEDGCNVLASSTVTIGKEEVDQRKLLFWLAGLRIPAVATMEIDEWRNVIVGRFSVL